MAYLKHLLLLPAGFLLVVLDSLLHRLLNAAQYGFVLLGALAAGAHSLSGIFLSSKAWSDEQTGDRLATGRGGDLGFSTNKDLRCHGLSGLLIALESPRVLGGNGVSESGEMNA